MRLAFRILDPSMIDWFFYEYEAIEISWNYSDTIFIDDLEYEKK